MNQDGEYAFLKFSSSNITQLLYLLYCMCFLNSLCSIKNDYDKNKIYTIFRAGVIAVVLICVYQLLAFRFNLEFDYFFRQNIHGNVQGDRIYGPCIEASMLCYYLVSAMALIYQNRRGYSDIVLLMAITCVGLISYSSTFLVGLAINLVVLLGYSVQHKISNRAMIFVSIIGILGILLIVFNSEYMVFLFRQIVNKINGSSVSGIERWNAFYAMAKVGLQYPFGVGWGSARSKDLFSTWLCNIGLAGLAIFIWFLLDYFLKAQKRNMIAKTYPFLLVVLLMMISVPEPYNFFVWIYLWYGSTERNYNMSCSLDETNVYE